MHTTRLRAGIIAALAAGCGGNVETPPSGSGGTADTTSTASVTTTTTSATTTTTTSSTMPASTPANVCDCAATVLSPPPSPGACRDCAVDQVLTGGACAELQKGCDVDPECQSTFTCAATCANQPDPAPCMAGCALESPIFQELMTCMCSAPSCKEACSVATPMPCDLDPIPVTCSGPQPFCAMSCFQAAAPTCNAGYWWCPPNTGPLCSCGVNDKFTCSTPSGCCMQDSDCGDPTGAICVNSVCKPVMPGKCWLDKDCAPGGVCVGALACPCTESCEKPDQPGTCQSP